MNISMLQQSQVLVNQWNSAGLHYCHWKGNDHLDEGLNGETDLDVLLLRDEKNKGCDILKGLGFVKFRSQYGSRYPNVEDWIGFDAETGRLLHLHLHYALMTGHSGMKEYELPWTEEALRTRHQDPRTKVFIMDSNLELVSLYTRLILKSKRKSLKIAQNGNYRMDKHFSKEINFIKKNVDENIVKDIASRYYGEDCELFAKIVMEDNLSSEGFLALYTIVNKKMSRYSRYKGLSLYIRRSYYPIAVRIKQLLRRKCGFLIITRKVVPNKGFSIAFLGQDGSGKSTVTQEIEKWLIWKIDAQRFYMGSGEHFDPWQKKLQYKLKHCNGPISRMIKSWLPFSLLCRLSRDTYKTIKKANKYVGEGGIAIYDRYPQMTYMGISDSPKIRTSLMSKTSGLLHIIASWYANIEERNISRAIKYSPDIVVKLMLPPEESIRRKPYEDFEKIKQKHEVIKQLHFSKSIEYVVDATQEYNKELIQIKNIIWQNIQG